MGKSGLTKLIALYAEANDLVDAEGAASCSC